MRRRQGLIAQKPASVATKRASENPIEIEVPVPVDANESFRDLRVERERA